MGFKTIDLDKPGGYERYKKLQETKSIKKAFEDEEPVRSEAVPVETPIEAPKIEVNKTGKVIGVDQLRVRKTPNGDILYLISRDSIVKILDESGSWLLVETAPGKSGYVMSQFIEITTTGG